MRRSFGWILLSAWLLAGCTGRAEAVRAAQPYIEDFGELRLKALSLLELRSDVQRQRLLAQAMKGDEASLPENLKLKAGGSLTREVHNFLGYHAVETHCRAVTSSAANNGVNRNGGNRRSPNGGFSR